MQSRTRYHGWFFNLQSVTALIIALLIGVAGVRAADPVFPEPSPSGGGSSVGGSMPTATVSSTYTLSPYDVIDVSVYNEEDLHTRTRLGADGTAILPLIGTVSLAGKTVSEANEMIQKRYAAGFVKDPHVLLTVLEYRKSSFSILGQVVRPGIYEIPEGVHLTIVDAVLLAGGFTRIADKNGVRIKRMVKGKPTIFKVKAGAMADSANVAPFDIEPGDIVTVNESWW